MRVVFSSTQVFFYIVCLVCPSVLGKHSHGEFPRTVRLRGLGSGGNCPPCICDPHSKSAAVRRCHPPGCHGPPRAVPKTLPCVPAPAAASPRRPLSCAATRQQSPQQTDILREQPSPHVSTHPAVAPEPQFRAPVPTAAIRRRSPPPQSYCIVVSGQVSLSSLHNSACEEEPLGVGNVAVVRLGRLLGHCDRAVGTPITA